MISNFFKRILGIFGKVIFLIIVGILVVFAINNQQVVNISLSPFPFEIETRLFLVIVLCFFSGILIGALSSSLSLGKEKIRNFGQSWKIKFLEKKVHKDAKSLNKNTDK